MGGDGGSSRTSWRPRPRHVAASDGEREPRFMTARSVIIDLPTLARAISGLGYSEKHCTIVSKRAHGYSRLSSGCERAPPVGYSRSDKQRTVSKIAYNCTMPRAVIKCAYNC